MARTPLDEAGPPADGVTAGARVAGPAKPKRADSSNRRPAIPKPTVPGSAAGLPQQTSTDGSAGRAAPVSPSPARTAVSPGGGGDAGAWQAAATPLAMGTMAALTAISGQYGNGEPATPPDGTVPGGPESDNGAHLITEGWDGHGSRTYHLGSGGASQQVTAMQHINSELARILGGSASSTTTGRTSIAAIIAEVDAALTALGPVTDTPAGRSLVTATLASALQRAGIVAGQGQTAAGGSADAVSALADQYLRESGGPRPQRHYGRRGGLGPTGGPPLSRPTGAKGQWIDEALRVLRQHGYDTSRISPADIGAMIDHESGGNPHAINLWDSNAVAGHPSKGLMQTIDSTFAAHALPGHRDIWNPVDNIIAGVRYAVSRYGSISNVPGVERLHHGQAYVGY